MVLQLPPKDSFSRVVRWFCENGIYSPAPASEHEQSGIPHSPCLVYIVLGSKEHKGRSYEITIPLDGWLYSDPDLVLQGKLGCKPLSLQRVQDMSRECERLIIDNHGFPSQMASVLYSEVFFKCSYLARSTRFNLVATCCFLMFIDE
jgi:hypothetical protein